MEVRSTPQIGSDPKPSSTQTGFNALSANDFLKKMIVQLQNQDPLEPTGNEELLNQISQMRSLQSNVELGDVLKSVATQQQLSSAAALIGRTVSGTTQDAGGDQETLTGVADRAFIRGGAAFVGIGSREIPLVNLTSIEQ